MGIKALYGTEIAPWRHSSNPSLAQSSDLLVQNGQGLLKNFSVARVFRRVELLQNPAAGELQSFFAGFYFSLFGCEARFGFSGRTGIVLLKFNRLTLPPARHTKIIREPTRPPWSRCTPLSSMYSMANHDNERSAICVPMLTARLPGSGGV